eukprot:TRINITY_DN8733_c0_g1_i3.p1 TRINITY_DN8733_c0_g1~~TRINITY_DN8733_c0_g1_i3.p1  ORF type:complete len:226 (+),score=31.90 TRINITY_DN8733_c0_g1_i3:1852-2529(+)
MTDVYSLSNASSSSFFDFDEDGTNDLFILSHKNGTTHIHGAFNNLNNDAFFFKTLALNGVCTQWCDGTIIPDPKPYGVNQHGASMKFVYSEMTGTVHVSAVAQLSQSAYSPLLTPYTLNGLGRPANYIDYFYLGVPINSLDNLSQGHWYRWPGLIPNSQIVAIPYPSSTPSSWTPELYITPSGAILWIIISVISSIIIFGSSVIIFMCLEKKQDEAEQKSFDRLF